MTFKELWEKDIKLWGGSKAEAVFIDSVYENLKQHYIKQQKDWYINERFVRGDHWIVFNKTLNQIQQLPISEGEVRRTVNKIRTQVRGVKNFIKRNQPRWQTAPSDASDESLEEALKYNKVLQHIYETQAFVSLLTDVIVNALKFSVGILEASLVPHNNGSILNFWVNDTFDIFFDPEATSIKDSRFILKVVKKSLTSIKNNKDYKMEWSLVADNKDGASDYKDILEKEKYNKQGQWKALEDFSTILLKELWLKTKDGKIKVITSAGGQVIREKTTSYKRFPFFIYNPEREPNSIYSDPWIKDLISLNKSLDKTVSGIESYIQRMLWGKWLVKRWVEVSTITDKGAEIITYKGNVAPKQQDLQPLPSTPAAFANSLERWIEEFGGMREASLGRAPGSLQSGKGIEALQSSDAATVAEPIENLELFLSEIGEFILDIISENQVVSNDFTMDRETVKYIGSEAPTKPSDTLVISPRKVKVVIVPELAYSEDAKKEMIFKLAESEMIDQETLLEYLNVSNIGDIIERVKKKKEEAYKEEMMKQKASHDTGGDGPEDSAELADQENMAMASGQEVPATPRALWTPEHTELHIAFIQENADAYQQNEEIYNNHILQEEQYANQWK